MAMYGRLLSVRIKRLPSCAQTRRGLCRWFADFNVTSLVSRCWCPSCCYPHGQTTAILRGLPPAPKANDESALQSPSCRSNLQAHLRSELRLVSSERQAATHKSCRHQYVIAQQIFTPVFQSSMWSPGKQCRCLREGKP